jgi:hypothetical protein
MKNSKDLKIMADISRFNRMANLEKKYSSFLDGVEKRIFLEMLKEDVHFYDLPEAEIKKLAAKNEELFDTALENIVTLLKSSGYSVSFRENDDREKYMSISWRHLAQGS